MDATDSGAPIRPQAILFDWDNTLVDSWPVIQDALNVTLEAYGLEPWSLEETRGRVRKSMRDSFPDLFGAEWEEAGAVFYERYEAIHTEQVVPLPGVSEALEALWATEVYLGVISNKKGDFLRAEARHLGWDGYFGAMVGAFDAERDKPAADVIKMALQGSGIDVGLDVWVAGDADIDLECAHNAGCTPILVRDSPPGPGEMDSHPPARHFPGCDALCKYVKSL